MDGDQSIGGRPDSTDTLTAIAVPTLVLSGTEDQVTGPDEGRALAAAIRDARFMQVERAGHLANLERPEVVNEALLGLSYPYGSELRSRASSRTPGGREGKQAGGTSAG